MNARSALFDLYGDHVRARGGAAPVAALVTMLGALDVAAPAVRTAVSRMVRQGWLAPARVGPGPGYRLTARAEHRLAEAAQRIYRTDPRPWDHRWHIVVVDRLPDRARRERMRNGLTYLGYATARDGTWISPHGSDEVEGILAAEHATGHVFHASYDGDPVTLAATCWDLQRLGREYERWLLGAQALVGADPPSRGDHRRGRLRHPVPTRARVAQVPLHRSGLAERAAAGRLAGAVAGDYFDREAARLLPAAERYVEECLHPNGASR